MNRPRWCGAGGDGLQRGKAIVHTLLPQLGVLTPSPPSAPRFRSRWTMQTPLCTPRCRQDGSSSCWTRCHAGLFLSRGQEADHRCWRVSLSLSPPPPPPLLCACVRCTHVRCGSAWMSTFPVASCVLQLTILHPSTLPAPPSTHMHAPHMQVRNQPDCCR
jgi:hypothetical protein